MYLHGSFQTFALFNLILVQDLDNLDLENGEPGFFPAVQHQMESQLLGDPEMMHSVLGSSFVQSTLSTSSPQLTRQLILSNPQIQKLLQSSPEVEDMLNNTDVMKQVCWCMFGVTFCFFASCLANVVFQQCNLDMQN